MSASSRRVAIIGLGYVGLPVAVAFGKSQKGVVGFDIDKKRIQELRNGTDSTEEVSPDELKSCPITFTSNPAELKKCDVFIVCVPTPIYEDRRPDLRALASASRTVGQAMGKGAVVVYESTVYPGLTEEYCGPILEEVSGLKRGKDFTIGYSPERINPGDKEHSFERIKKVVSGEDRATAELLAALYGSVVKAGIHVASNIKVAEAAKVLENTQRDLNIALMNELAIICDRLGIRTKEVLDAAATKWNFLNFRPGLVGGHCIGVDPYYLTSKAQELGYHPEVILAGRRINDQMGRHIAQRIVKFLSRTGRPLRESRVGILGLTFKEDVSDIRNSRVPDIVTELREYGIEALVHDPLADPEVVEHEYRLKLKRDGMPEGCDALVLAVPHKVYLADVERLWPLIGREGTFIDVKSAVDPARLPPGIHYWSL